jgi:hypothetical protein
MLSHNCQSLWELGLWSINSQCLNQLSPTYLTVQDANCLCRIFPLMKIPSVLWHDENPKILIQCLNGFRNLEQIFMYFGCFDRDHGDEVQTSFMSTLRWYSPKRARWSSNDHYVISSKDFIGLKMMFSELLHLWWCRYTRVLYDKTGNFQCIWPFTSFIRIEFLFNYIDKLVRCCVSYWEMFIRNSNFMFAGSAKSFDAVV